MQLRGRGEGTRERERRRRGIERSWIRDNIVAGEKEGNLLLSFNASDYEHRKGYVFIFAGQIELRVPCVSVVHLLTIIPSNATGIFFSFFLFLSSTLRPATVVFSVEFNASVRWNILCSVARTTRGDERSEIGGCS